jgi:hypothetical protein
MGGSFKVPPGNTADSALLRVNQGEEVDVKPARQSGLSNLETLNVRIGDTQFMAFLEDKVGQILNSGTVQIRREGAIKIA